MPVTTITGTEDDDRLDGTKGRDLFLALGGDDWIVTVSGHDTMDCGAGNDSVFAYTGGTLTLGGEGDDQLVTSDSNLTEASTIRGGLGDDQIFAGTGNDLAYGGQGDDQVTIYFRGSGHAEGGQGRDHLVFNLFNFTQERAVLVLNGSDAGIQVGATAFQTLDGFESLDAYLGAGDDYVRAGRLDDRMFLGAGANTALALGGDDFVSCQVGWQHFTDGGAGLDVMQLLAARDQTLVFQVTGDQAGDQFGSSYANFEKFLIHAGRRDDSLTLGRGNDTLYCGYGDDTATGGDGRDQMLGEDGADLLSGGDGADHISGGAGSDTLSGGAGADEFVFGAVSHFGDLILDFAPGQDVLFFRGRLFDPDMAKGALDPARFALGTASGDLAQFVYRGSSTADENELVWDSNGAGAGGEVLVARFTGLPDLGASAFLIT